MNECDQLDVSVPLIKRHFRVSWSEALELMVTTPEFGIKGGTVWARDAIRVAKWDMSHPVEAAERRRFVEGILAKNKRRS